MRTLPKMLLITSLATLGGCINGYYPFLYHAPVQQGNIISPAAVAELHPGMNKAEVANYIGEPLLQTPFSSNTWYFVYTMRRNNKVVTEQHVTLYFVNDTLVRIVSAC